MDGIKVAYPYAQKNLSPQTLDTINLECEAFEKEMAEKNLQNKYIKLIEEFETKYVY